MIYNHYQGVSKERFSKLLLIATAFIFTVGAGVIMNGSVKAEPVCQDVTTSKGSLTAARVGGDVTGEVDANGCDIGAYFNNDNQGSVANANVHDANRYGVFVDGKVAGDLVVDITGSDIYNIGNHDGSGVFAPNGNQTGLGVYYFAFGTEGTVSGEIANNRITDWQKGGITCNGQADCVIKNNRVGESASNKQFLAPNSIQIAVGAIGDVQHNNIEGSSWCGQSNYAATAILLFEHADGTVIRQNNIRGDSDVAIYMLGGQTVVDNNKVFEDRNAEDCNKNGYDFGIGNWGAESEVTNNKVKGFDVAYESVTGGKNKAIPGSQKSNPAF